MKQTLLALALFTISLPSFALNVGDPAPCVVLEQIDRQGRGFEGCIRDVKVASQQFTLVEFFSIHCSTCRANNPIINRLANELRSKAHLRFVSIDRNAAEVAQYRQQNQSAFPTDLAFDNERLARRAYGVVSTPTLFVLDQQFNIVYKHQGLLTERNLNQIRQIVGK